MSQSRSRAAASADDAAATVNGAPPPEPAPDVFLDAAAGVRQAEEEASVRIESLPRLPLDRIAPHPDNPPERSADTPDARDVAHQILQHGLQQPITVAERWRIEQDDPEAAKRLPADADWVTISGHVRCTAHRINEIPDIPALLRDGPCDKVTITEIFLSENFGRVTPDPIMEGQAYERLSAAGLTETQIANRRGVKQPHVNKTMKLTHLPDEVAAHLRDGSLTRADAYHYLSEKDEVARDAAWAAWLDNPNKSLRLHHKELQARARSESQSSKDDKAQRRDDENAAPTATTREQAIDAVLGWTVSATVRADILADAMLASRPRKSELASWKARVARTLGVDLPDDVPLTALRLRQSVYRRVALGIALWTLESDAAEDDTADEPYRPHVARYIQRLADLGAYQPSEDEIARMAD